MITRRDQWTAYVVLGLFSILALYPVLGILGLALHTKDDQITGFALPTSFSLETFEKAWTDGNFATGLWSSFIVAVAVTAVAVLLSIGTGYAFGTMRFPGDSLIFGLILLGLIFPYEATVIPLYYDLQAFDLTNTYWALTFYDSAFMLARAMEAAGTVTDSKAIAAKLKGMRYDGVRQMRYDTDGRAFTDIDIGMIKDGKTFSVAAKIQ